MRPGTVDCAPLAPCAPWCQVPPVGFNPADYPEWCCEFVDLEDPVQRARAEWSAQVASSILFRLSSSLFNGCCETTEYLCLDTDSCGCPSLGWSGSVPWRSYPDRGTFDSWVNRRCPCDRASCECATGRRILLPHQPVTSIESVSINGAEQDPGSYRVVDGRWLTLPADLDIGACFDPLTDPAGGFAVTWTFGQAPPPEGLLAACVLACELTKACLGASCQLPKRVQSVSRQGVSWTVLDPQEFLSEGRVGLYEVDLFLGIYGQEEPTTVLHPEEVEPIDFGLRPSRSPR